MFPPLLSVPSCTPLSRNVVQGYLLLVLVSATHCFPRLGPPSGPTPNKTGGRPALTSGAPRVLSPTLCLGRSPGRLLLGHSVVPRGHINLPFLPLDAVGAPGALDVFSRIKRKSPERFRFRHEEATTEKAPFSSTFSFSLSTSSLSSPDEAASNLPALSSETCESLRRAQFSDIGS